LANIDKWAFYWTSANSW